MRSLRMFLPGLLAAVLALATCTGCGDGTEGLFNFGTRDGSGNPESASIYGYVTCDGKGVAGVAVSDGVEVVKTDQDGMYRITSFKELGYVFISIPGGYEVPTKGVLPIFHATLGKPANEAERVDFSLNKADNDNFKLVVMGDIHLANRNNDRVEFFKFTSDVRDYRAAHPGERIYGLTLGDMTWDYYWYDRSYQFPQYLSDINDSSHGFGGMTVFHTIGNHDHDMKAAGDFDTEQPFVRNLAPTYYSFNLGKVHFIVLDDILCTNPGNGDRSYKEKLDDVQTTWLKNDLRTVFKSTPIVVAMHAPIYHDNADNDSLDPVRASEFSSFFKLFEGYKVVHLLTGHTHRVLNADFTGSSNYFEHNAGAVCATWWWTQKYYKVNVGTDGTPGGWELWEVNGTDLKWQFRATGEKPEFQFRTYDLNKVCFDATATSTWIPGGSSWAKKHFVSRFGSRFPKRYDNAVLINVWGYDKGWKIKVTEKTSSGDKALIVKQIKTYDPLHVIAMSAVRYNDPTLSEAPSFQTVLSTHMFEAKAGSSDTTIEIEVTDRFGNVYRETMTRPKAFNIANYRSDYYKTY